MQNRLIVHGIANLWSTALDFIFEAMQISKCAITVHNVSNYIKFAMTLKYSRSTMQLQKKKRTFLMYSFINLHWTDAITPGVQFTGCCVVLSYLILIYTYPITKKKYISTRKGWVTFRLAKFKKFNCKICIRLILYNLNTAIETFFDKILTAWRIYR